MCCRRRRRRRQTVSSGFFLWCIIFLWVSDFCSVLKQCIWFTQVCRRTFVCKWVSASFPTKRVDSVSYTIKSSSDIRICDQHKKIHCQCHSNLFRCLFVCCFFLPQSLSLTYTYSLILSNARAIHFKYCATG